MFELRNTLLDSDFMHLAYTKQLLQCIKFAFVQHGAITDNNQSARS